MRKYRVWLFLILCNLFWAGNFVFGKYVLLELSALWITFIRWLMASIILLLIAIIFEKVKWKYVLKSWPMLMFLGINGIIVFNLSLYTALNYTSPTNASLISALNPALMVAVSAVFLKEKLSNLQKTGIFISLAGVMVVVTGGQFERILRLDFNRGDLLMLLAISAWTVYSILGKRLKNIPPITATAVSAILATVLMAPFALSQGTADLTQLSTLAISGLLYVIIFPSVVSFIFWNKSVREIGAAKASVFLNLIPVFTTLFSWMLGDKISLFQVTGGIIVIVGVYLTTGMFEKLLAKRNQQSTSE